MTITQYILPEILVVDSCEAVVVVVVVVEEVLIFVPDPVEL
jgi:hypothetical protein